MLPKFISQLSTEQAFGATVPLLGEQESARFSGRSREILLCFLIYRKIVGFKFSTQPGPLELRYRFCRMSDDRRDEIFAYKSFGGVTMSRDAAWRALLTCQ